MWHGNAEPMGEKAHPSRSFQKNQGMSQQSAGGLHRYGTLQLFIYAETRA